MIEAFPEFKQLNNELLMLRYKTKELINMFDVMREALCAADEGTVLYMIEERQKELEENKKKLAENKQKLIEQSEQLAEQSEQLAQKDEELVAQRERIAELEAQLRK